MEFSGGGNSWADHSIESLEAGDLGVQSLEAVPDHFSFHGPFQSIKSSKGKVLE